MANQNRIYLLDANVYIQAHRRYYDFDICPGYWDCLFFHLKRLSSFRWELQFLKPSAGVVEGMGWG